MKGRRNAASARRESILEPKPRVRPAHFTFLGPTEGEPDGVGYLLGAMDRGSRAQLWLRLCVSGHPRRPRRLAVLPCYWPKAINLPRHDRLGHARPAPALSTPLPSRAGRRSEQEFQGHARRVLSSLPGLASFLAPVPQDESLGLLSFASGPGGSGGENF